MKMSILKGSIAIGILAILLLGVGVPEVVAGEVAPTAAPDANGLRVLGLGIGAGLALGLAAIGAGYGVGVAGAAGLGAIAEKPEMVTWTLVIVALAEGIALYGLVIAFMIIGKI
jgi:V/A-type H+-transporting ATPase subunit K